MQSLTIPDPQKLSWRTTYAESTINASRDTVWHVLTDFANYDVWNHFTYDVQMSKLDVGKTFSFKVCLISLFQHRQHEMITLIDREQYALGWRYFFKENPILSAVRYQVLTEIDPHTTRYQTWETFNGITAPLLKLTVLGRVQRGFDKMAHDLKTYCEAQL